MINLILSPTDLKSKSCKYKENQRCRDIVSVGGTNSLRPLVLSAFVQETLTPYRMGLMIKCKTCVAYLYFFPSVPASLQTYSILSILLHHDVSKGKIPLRHLLLQSNHHQNRSLKESITSGPAGPHNHLKYQVLGCR